MICIIETARLITGGFLVLLTRKFSPPENEPSFARLSFAVIAIIICDILLNFPVIGGWWIPVNLLVSVAVMKLILRFSLIRSIITGAIYFMLFLGAVALIVFNSRFIPGLWNLIQNAH